MMFKVQVQQKDFMMLQTIVHISSWKEDLMVIICHGLNKLLLHLFPSFSHIIIQDSNTWPNALPSFDSDTWSFG